MSKALSLLLTIAFLGAQTLFFAHATEYGFWKHEHEGTACEICLSAKYQDCTSPGATSGACLLCRAEYVPQPPVGTIIVRDTYDSGITRGPPLFS